MKDKIKLVCCDIDGTLTAQSADPNELTIKTIDELRKQGYLFGLASGRPVDDIMNKYQTWGVEKQFDFLIGYNGCELFDCKTGEKHTFNSLKKEWLKEIVVFMRQFKAIISEYIPNTYLCSEENERAWYSAYKNKRKFVVAKDEAEFYQDDNCGIMFRVDVKDMPKVEKAISELKDKPYVGFKTQPFLMEFAHKDSHKGVALKKYCDLYQIDLDECMAFGDTTNDNGMLKICHGVCLKNGSDDTKALAEFITDKTNLEDGWVDFVQKNLMKR